jgi:hypothetical protein
MRHSRPRHENDLSPVLRRPVSPAGGFEADVAATRRGLKESAQADRVVVKIGGDVFDDGKEQ